MAAMTKMPTCRRARVAGTFFVDPREIISLLFLLVVYALAAISRDNEFIVAVNETGICVLILIMLYGSWRNLQQSRSTIWIPLVWFRVATAAYFGLGQLVPYIANDATVDSILQTYNFNDAEILKVNVICDLGVICVLAGASLIGPVARTVGRIPKPSAGPSLFLAVAFTIIGAILRYGFVVPYSLGYIEVIPGVTITLSKAYSAGLLLLLLSGLQRGGTVLIVAAGLTALDILISTLLFSKSEVLTMVIFAMLAVWHRSPRFKTLAIASLAVVVTYVSLVPFVMYGRSEIFERYGSMDTRVPLEERLAIVQDYFSYGKDQFEQATNGVQGSLSRLCYVNIAAAVVSWRERGSLGDSLRYAPMVFIPRIMWPDKPDVSIIGAELYTAVTGQSETYISPGLFAEAYWDLGWLGVPLMMFPYGILLGVLSRLSLAAIERDQWIFLPAVLAGLTVGFRVDGWYVMDVLGGGSTVLLLYAALSGLDRFFSVTNRASAFTPNRRWQRNVNSPARPL
jgi:hypothetical protein